jgi:hypothetical protein
MTLESTIIDLTSKTPSGGTCWIGEVPFTVSYCSDCWEWEFQGVYYFDPLDLSEAIEAFLEGLRTKGRETALPATEGQAGLRPLKGKTGHHGAQKRSLRSSVRFSSAMRPSVRRGHLRP